MICTAVHDLAADQQRLHCRLGAGLPDCTMHAILLRPLTHSAGPAWQQRLDGQQQQRYPGVRCDTSGTCQQFESTLWAIGICRSQAGAVPMTGLICWAQGAPITGCALCCVCPLWSRLGTLADHPSSMHGSMRSRQAMPASPCSTCHRVLFAWCRPKLQPHCPRAGSG